MGNIEKEAEKIVKSIINIQDNDTTEVIIRAIRSTGDLDLIGTLRISKNAIKNGIRSVKNGILVDTKMAKAALGDIAIYKEPQIRNSRYYSQDLIENYKDYINDRVIMVGTSPIALMTLNNMIKNKMVKPSLVIGVPVGFVNALKSKIELTNLDVEYITNISIKGGVALGVSIVRALVKLSES
jgi:precorrin-8X/cobalt-precorrin-8 methylmutase